MQKTLFSSCTAACWLSEIGMYHYLKAIAIAIYVASYVTVAKDYKHWIEVLLLANMCSTGPSIYIYIYIYIHIYIASVEL